jgi:hypothetical protein
MIASFKDIAAAMTRCVAIIEDYARLAPSTLTTTAALAAVHNGSTAVNAGYAAAVAAASTPAGNKKQRNKKEKKAKDPNAPKRPPSAYLLFQNDVREKIRTAQPGMPYREVLGVIAKRWKDLSDPERKYYDDLYNLATTEFHQQNELYKATQGTSDSDSDSDSDTETPARLPPTLATATPLTSSKKVKKRKGDEVMSTPLDKKKKTKKGGKD